MTLLGLSILIASVSFLCYRHPPSTWALLTWLRRPSLKLEPAEQKKVDAPKEMTKAPASIPTITSHEDMPEIKGEGIPTITTMDTPTKDEIDRKAMPPPPPPLLKKPSSSKPQPSSPTTPRATATSIPSFALAESDSDLMPPPSFPALNSAQRASGGTGAPPRLAAFPTPQPSLTQSRPQTTSRNSTLMTPPSRTPNPLPNRGPPSSNLAATSLAPPPTHSTPPSKPRKKVLLTPGHSPLDWASLCNSPTANLRGLPPNTPYLRVPPSLLKTMTGRKGKDAWTVLGGRVYNITPYLPYHPGGEPELLRCAGRDGSRLFGEVHPWVNFEGMLEGCLVGIAVEEGELPGKGEMEEMD
ncbi:hypothetical protein G7Y89_g15058 [Cudoniella acicularis]|uniref:Cytochrome b5 heme-binding domain-containing protein n=1 Tax=Cudoniella acicularis TaxID=354080 RepID=A0A8H4QUJ1_9HELO|nr:hypothetical protein G7Y89_g15058 [Cudoniella acicularis]